jgi:hypothetical protein
VVNILEEGGLFLFRLKKPLGIDQILSGPLGSSSSELPSAGVLDLGRPWAFERAWACATALCAMTCSWLILACFHSISSSSCSLNVDSGIEEEVRLLSDEVQHCENGPQRDWRMDFAEEGVRK